MKLSYRARRTWHRVGIAALAIAVLAALMIFVWTVWLGRYVVYTRDGATLDFNSSAEMIARCEDSTPLGRPLVPEV